MIDTEWIKDDRGLAWVLAAVHGIADFYQRKEVNKGKMQFMMMDMGIFVFWLNFGNSEDARRIYLWKCVLDGFVNNLESKLGKQMMRSNMKL